MVLICDGYAWDQSKILLNTITKACKLKNYTVHTRLPINCNLLEMILFEVQRHFYGATSSQPFLCKLYQALFVIAYYGLMRVGELAHGLYTVKAKDVHVADNKDKILLVLHTSKTHGRESRPQKIRISTSNSCDQHERKYTRHFGPFKLMRKYWNSRGRDYLITGEPFFIFADRLPVQPDQVRTVLCQMLDNLHLDSSLYDTHSMHIGCASDMFNKFHYTLEEVKRAGHWKSNAVYHYLRS